VLRAATARSDIRGSTRPRWPAGDRACAPAAVAAAQRFTTPSSGAVRGAPSRGGRFHPTARVPCRPPRPLCAGALRGGGVARPRRAAAAAVAAAASLSLPHAPPATATWLYVPPCALAAMEPAGVPVSIRCRARHRPEGQGIARTCLELYWLRCLHTVIL